jgi:hypothetical protein
VSRNFATCGTGHLISLEAAAEDRIRSTAIEEQVLALVRAEVTAEVNRRGQKIRDTWQVHGWVTSIEIEVDDTRIAEIERRLCYRLQMVVAVRGIDEGRETLNDARVAGWKSTRAVREDVLDVESAAAPRIPIGRNRPGLVDNVVGEVEQSGKVVEGKNDATVDDIVGNRAL